MEKAVTRDNDTVNKVTSLTPGITGGTLGSTAISFRTGHKVSTTPGRRIYFDFLKTYFPKIFGTPFTYT